MIKYHLPSKSSKCLRWIALSLVFWCSKCAIKVGNPHTDSDGEKKKIADSSAVLASSYLACVVLPVTSTASTTVQIGCSVYTADGAPVATNKLAKGIDWTIKTQNSDNALDYQKSTDPSGKYNIIFTVTGKDSGTILQTIDASQITANTTASSGNSVLIHGTVHSSESGGTKLTYQNNGFHYYHFVVDQFDNGTTSGTISQISLQYNNAWHQYAALQQFGRKAGGVPANQNGIAHSNGASEATDSQDASKNSTGSDQNVPAKNSSEATNASAGAPGEFYFPQKVIITGYTIEGGDKQLGCPLAYHLEASDNDKHYSTVAGSSGNKLSCKGDPQTFTFKH